MPIGIPLLGGPGTLTIAIADPVNSSIDGKISLSLIVLLLSLIIFLIFDAAEMLSSKISVSAL